MRINIMAIIVSTARLLAGEGIQYITKCTLTECRFEHFVAARNNAH